MELKYTLSRHQASASLGGESVVLNYDKGTYYNLNEVGTFIWKLIENNALTVSEIVHMLTQEYEIDATSCQTDVQALLNDMLDEKLVVEVPEPL